ncbi:MAG: NUDIX hydrolase, partial [Nitrososphaerales archaeon]
ESCQVLLREPRGHFDRYVWTFSKGAPNKNEVPVDTALRETREEMARSPEIIGHIPGVFEGGNTSSANYFYLMFDDDPSHDPAAKFGWETNAVRWASHEKARELISESTNEGGRGRDLETLEAAYREFERLKPA